MCGGRRSDTGRGSTGGSRTVQVRGYMRANGTYVAPYTRSLPGSGSKAKPSITHRSSSLINTNGQSFSSGKKINSTPVQAISKSPAKASVAASFQAGARSLIPVRRGVHVQGNTRSNGTYVTGHTRSFPSPLKGNSPVATTQACNGSSGLFCSSVQCGHQPTNPSVSSSVKVVHVRGYTRSNGTRVASYTRSYPTKSTKTIATVIPVSSIPIRKTTQTQTQRVQFKDAFKQCTPPPAVETKRGHCSPAQTAVQGS